MFKHESYQKPASPSGQECFSGSCSRPTKACDENLVDGFPVPAAQRACRPPAMRGMLFRRAVLGSPRLHGSHVLLRRTGREQALERTRQSFGGELLGVRQPMPVRRLGGLGEIELM